MQDRGHGGGRGRTDGAQAENGLPANGHILGRVEQVPQRRHRRLGVGADLRQRQAGPICGAAVVQGLRQGGHGRLAHLGQRIHGADLHRRIRVFHDLGQQGDGGLRIGTNVAKCPHRRATHVHVRILQQRRDGFDRRLGGGTDLPERGQGMDADAG